MNISVLGVCFFCGRNVTEPSTEGACQCQRTLTLNAGAFFTINGVPLTITGEGELTQELTPDQCAAAFNAD